MWEKNFQGNKNNKEKELDRLIEKIEQQRLIRVKNKKIEFDRLIEKMYEGEDDGVL